MEYVRRDRHWDPERSRRKENMARDHGPQGKSTDHVAAPAAGRVFAFRAGVFDAANLRRALTRIAHEIVERNQGADDVVLVGMYTRGVVLAQRLAAAIRDFEAVDVPVGTLDPSFFRDDIG